MNVTKHQCRRDRVTTGAAGLADTVVRLRHFEALGQMRQSISVLEVRHGDHVRTVREVQFGDGGLTLGPPLKDFTGVLSGSPRRRGRTQVLLEDDQEATGG